MVGGSDRSTRDEVINVGVALSEKIMRQSSLAFLTSMPALHCFLHVFLRWDKFAGKIKLPFSGLSFGMNYHRAGTTRRPPASSPTFQT